MMDQRLVEALAEKGILGMLIVAIAIILWRKDQDLTAERNARREDAQKFSEKALELQSVATATAHKLADAFEAQKALYPKIDALLQALSTRVR
jgi:hypothetical protein